MAPKVKTAVVEAMVAAKPAPKVVEVKAAKAAKVVVEKVAKAENPAKAEKATKPVKVAKATKGKKIDDGKPKEKKAATPYIVFCTEQRKAICAANPEASFGGIGQLLGEAWRNMSEQKKAVSCSETHFALKTHDELACIP
jgi:hypothetical protein